MVIGHLLRVVRARFKIIMLIFLTTVATSVVVSLVVSKKYSATTALVVDLRGADSILGQSGTGNSSYSLQSILSTQTDILTSQRVVDKVIQTLSLEDRAADLLGGDAAASTDRAALRARLSEALLKKLDVRSSREGSTLMVSYEGTDPALVQKIANAFAQAYVEATVDLKTEPAAKFRDWFEAQTRASREAFEQAQKRLTIARQETGITSTDAREDVETTRLNELSTQLATVQAALADTRLRSSNLEGKGRESMPDVVQNALIQTLRSDLGRAQARFEQLGSRVGTSHPEYLSAQAEVNGLRQRLDQEISRVAGSVAAANSVNTQREAQLRQAVEAQRAKMLRQRSSWDRVNLLEREVENARKALDMVTTRLNETNLESQVRQSNVSILTPATYPTEPSRPKPLLNALIGALVGLFMAMIAAFTLEALQKPLRDSLDLLEAAGVAVLAVLPHAASQRPQRLIGHTGQTLGPPTLRLGN
jgi:succinoglycan biosynthesis transport protein ExoP